MFLSHLEAAHYLCADLKLNIAGECRSRFSAPELSGSRKQTRHQEFVKSADIISC